MVNVTLWLLQCINDSRVPVQSPTNGPGRNLGVDRGRGSVLNTSVEDILRNPDKYENESKAVYGMLAKIPDEAVVEDFMVHYMDQIYKYV